MSACKRAAELIARSLETPLTWRQRLALALHLCVCNMCRRFRRQLRLVQRAGRSLDVPEEVPGQDEVALPEEARDRIKRALREQGRGGAS
jgi:hypothetical protein